MAIIALSLFSANLHANTAPSVDQNYIATADSYIRNGGHSNTNYNGEKLKIKKGSSTGFTFRTVMKFPAIDCPWNIECDAVLKFFATSSSGSNLDLNLIGNSWSQGAVTWNNVPNTEEHVADIVMSSANNIYPSTNLSSYYQNNGWGMKSFLLSAKYRTSGAHSIQHIGSSAASYQLPRIAVSRQLPAVTLIEDQATSLGVNPAVFYDADGDALTLSALNLPDGLAYDSSTSTVSGSPTNAGVGTHTVTIKANDGNGGSANAYFTLAVTNTNDAPVVSNPPQEQTALVGNAFSMVLATDTFSDVDTGDTLTLSVPDALPDGLSFNSTTATFSGTPTWDAAGIHTVTVTADDGNGGSVDAAFELTVEHPNYAPVVSNPPSDQTALVTQTFLYALAADTFTDANVQDQLTLTVAAPLPDGLSFDSATATFSGTPTGAAVGSHTVSVTADDGNGGSVSAAFVLLVEHPNYPPALNNPPPDQTAMVDVFFSYALAANTFSDANADDQLTLSLAQTLPNGLSFSPGNGEFSGTPTGVDLGGFSVVVRATDSGGLFAEASMALTIVPYSDAAVVELVANLPTTAPALSNITIAEALVDNEDLYNAAIAAASPQPSTFAELQAIIDSSNRLAAALASAKAVDEGSESSGFETRLLELVGAPAVPSKLLAELAHAIDTTVQALITESALIALIEQFLDRVTYQPVLWLSMQQGGIAVSQIASDGGQVDITVHLGNPLAGVDTTFDWSHSDNGLLSLSNEANPLTQTLSFDPATLPTDGLPLYAIAVAERNNRRSVARLRVSILRATDAIEISYDSDNDGVADAYEGALDASLDPSVANQIQTSRGDDTLHVMETGLGFKLRLGETARQAKNHQSAITVDDIASHFPGTTPDKVLEGLPPNTALTEADLFDFEIAALSHVGESVRLVIPLQKALQENSHYLKFHPASGWTTFVKDGLNGLRSAPALAGVEGACPPADHSAYSSGFTEGHSCIEIAIEDGGPNDADRLNADGSTALDAGINGNIVDPGGISYLIDAEPNDPEEDLRIETGIKGKGGIALELAALILALYLKASAATTRTSSTARTSNRANRRRGG